MEIINQIQKLAFSTQVAVYSFLIGTVLFLLSFPLHRHELIYSIGLLFVYLATFINLMVLIWLLYYLIVNKYERQQIVIEILILLTNIPIALAYFLIIVEGIESNSPF